MTGIILAGGKSSRMGTEKGMVLIDGKPFVENIISVLSSFVDRVIIVSSNPVYEQFNCIRIEDAIHDSGPLAGIEAGLNFSTSQHNLVLSCDVPFMNEAVLELLLKHKSENKDLKIIQLKESNNLIPLIGIYDKSCAKDCFDLLKNGEKRLLQLSKKVKHLAVEVPFELKPFVQNINTKNELYAANENRNSNESKD